jgi:hypothetical protein
MSREHMWLNPTNKLSLFYVPPAINGANSAVVHGSQQCGQLNMQQHLASAWEKRYAVNMLKQCSHIFGITTWGYIGNPQMTSSRPLHVSYTVVRTRFILRVDHKLAQWRNSWSSMGGEDKNSGVPVFPAIPLHFCTTVGLSRKTT